MYKTTYETEYLMRLIGCGALGKEAPAPVYPLDWAALFREAERQNLFHVAAYALKISPATGCPENIRQAAINRLITASACNGYRREGVKAILDEFHTAGFDYAMLKGFASASLYTCPDARIGGDVDIYIDRSKEKEALSWFSEKGFNVIKRYGEVSHHSVIELPSIGELEIHVKFWGMPLELVYTNSEGYCFRAPEENFAVCGNGFYTLGPTDRIIYTALHMAHHFTVAQIGWRLILDMALVMKDSIKEADTVKFDKIMSECKCRTFINTALFIAREYFGIETGYKAECTGEMCAALLYSASEPEYKREISDSTTNTYFRESLTKKHGALRGRLLLSANYFSAAFISFKRLSDKYPVLKKYPVLYPFFWMKRFVSRSFVFLKTILGSDRVKCPDAEKQREAQKRIEGCRKLEML